jgi:integrase
LDKYNANYYLFGTDFLPAKEHAADRRFGKEWDKLRIALKLPPEMQLYSFRDTGIFEMLKSGVDDLTVMQHADHHSLDITTIYANHHDPNLSKIIYERAPEF